MVVIHFIEERVVLLTQLCETVPSVDEDRKIKGRKAKVVSVKEVEENIYHVGVILEKIVKKPLAVLDNKKRRR